MRPARLVAAVLAGVVVAGIPALSGSSSAAPAEPDPSVAAERELRGESSGRVTVRRDGRGVVRFVGTEPGKPANRPAGVASAESAVEKAKAHVRRYEALWALDHRGSDVRAVGRRAASNGQSVVRFEQTVGGVPVFGAELSVAVDADGDLLSVNGETTPLAQRDGALRVSEADAQRIATGLAERVHKVPAAQLSADPAKAFVFDPVLLGPSTKSGLVPVWQVEVTGRAHVRHLVLVDRQTGAVALQYNQASHALYRVVCDRENVRDTADGNGEPTLEPCVRNFKRIEGQGPSGRADVDAAYTYAGDTAQYFKDDLNVDLTALIGHDTGAGKRIRSTVRYCFPQSYDPECPMANAFWNGDGVYYGEGMPQSDDVVAHELAHGVTEKTSNLAYWYQSGAINESMSDVFGELTDLTNADAEVEDPWKLGEGSPFGVVRDMANPNATNQPSHMQDHAYYAGEDAEYFDNGGVHTNSGVGNKAAYLIARPSEEGPVVFNGQTITGIGYQKAKFVYYRAQQMLTSGADYLDLYNVLPQACLNLVGTAGISTADCENTVRKAVIATKMNLQPKASAAAPEAKVCDSGTKKDIFLDGFGSTANWAYTSGLWSLIDYYAKSGTKSFYGREFRTGGQPLDSYARITKKFTIPSGVKTYLRFDHQYGFAYWPGDDASPTPEYYAGARVLYSTNGGSTWQSTSLMTWDNGPTKNITSYDANNNPKPAYRGFGGDSHGYQSSRLDLSSLAGKTVMLRWHVRSDPKYYYDGWTLDDVNVYACGGVTPSNASGLTPVGGVGQATVKWTAPVWPGEGGLTKYTVTVRRGDTLVKTVDVAPSATSTVITGLSRGVSYRFHVQPYAAGGPGPSTSRGLIGARVSSALTDSTIRSGQPAKLYGKVTRVDSGAGVSGLTVWLQGRKKGSTTWSDVTKVSSGSGGAYSFTRYPSATWEYRAVYKSGFTTYMGATSDARTVYVS